jgi:multiple sugar transport system permease protein
MVFLSLSMLLPFSWMIATSLRLPKNSFSLPPSIFPTNFKLEGYFEVFKKVAYPTYYINSIFIALCVVVGVVVVSSMAGYALARIKFPGREIWFILMLTGMMVPAQVTIIPQFLFISRFGLVNNHISMILPVVFSPISIFLIRQHMKNISSSYEEAAIIDGASRLRIFISIIIPMSMPAIIVTAVLSFIASWNEFFRALIFLNSDDKMTLPIGIMSLKGAYGAGNLSSVLAAIVMSMVVTLLFFIFGQKYLMEGLMNGGIKE